MYDIIGDVHGHAKELIMLLKKLGYKNNRGFFEHSKGRKVIFLGDYIDRGNEEEKVINIVKNMVDNNQALAILGNHEYNAICYATKDQKGNYLREHSKKNYEQHKDFLEEYPFGSEKHKKAIEWFKTLPVFLDLDNLRAVHACWNNIVVDKIQPYLNSDNTININYLKTINQNKELFQYYEILLKGIEVTLPNNQSWKDKLGHERNTIRLNWFNKKEKYTYKTAALSVPDYVDLPDIEIKDYFEVYNDEKPVFFGHYWLQGKPRKQTNKTACLDYSVAKKGKLVAYQFYKETYINNANFIY
tara:strand:+ start:26547 stop:27449 length:903 start_codon:yes stop_codon:yes gene_type:complete